MVASGSFVNFSLEACDGRHTPKMIGLLNNKKTGKTMKVFRCACCRKRWKEVV